MVPDLDALPARLAGRPWLTLAGAVVGALVLAYATLVMQELFLAIWLVVVGFVVHLALRFVRAVERITGAVERLVDARE